jgi:endonuclease YncB( thermonuclease family)
MLTSLHKSGCCGSPRSFKKTRSGGSGPAAVENPTSSRQSAGPSALKINQRMPGSAWLRITLAALGAAVLVNAAHADDDSIAGLRGRAISVHDGDTIKVQLDSGPINVRFYGVDAPELNQAHGAESRNTLARLVESKMVDLEPVGQNSYDRLVAVVYVGELNVNEQMLKSGDAWAARKYLRKRSESGWCAYENAARCVVTAARGVDRFSRVVSPQETAYKYKDYSAETTAKCIAAIGKH